jgi:(E)-4-hydroxy-3-methylbut-2-enyl-diphosphate synthase
MAGIKRRETRIIKIGNVRIGGNNPVAIQSMAKTKTSDVERTIKQIEELESAGCEIVRIAVKDRDDARAIAKIKPNIDIPLVADIHFDWKLALEAIDSGVDKIRLNPGNIYKKDQLKEVSRAAKLARIPIRVGLNSGSLQPHKLIRLQSQKSPADKMVRSAVDYIKILEDFGFYNIVVSLKTSNIFDTIEAYRKMTKFCDYPFHLGITATGIPSSGIVKSTIVLSVLLLEGIGDTIRISLTEKPVEEVRAAKAVLESLGLRRFGTEIISCPTCGRCEVNLVKIVKDLERQLQATSCKLQARPMKVAVMGCVVNGPGEARQADLGIAFGKKEGILFKKDKAVRKVSADKCVDVLIKEIGKF